VGHPAGGPQPALAGPPRRLLRLPAAEARLARFPTDVCVPISRLAECIRATNEDIARSSIPIPLFGHVGDGNFHLVVLIDPANPKEVAEAEKINHAVVERALAMEGTCTGEHGVGIGKQKFLVAEHGEGAVDVMRALKQALDPENLLNPGKILP
jgi:D-lactate dehydrogenase (cytochrome)